MPNNSSARREKDKKKKDKKKKTDPPPLHKEDKASVDSSTLSLSLSSGNKGRTVSSANVKNKDASLALLHLGAVKPTATLSRNAEPKSDACVEWKNSQFLSKEERATVFAETKEANPGADTKEFNLAYKIALRKAGIKKGGTKDSGNLGEVDLSLFSETDVEDNSGEDSASSEDGMKAIRDDLER